MHWKIEAITLVTAQSTVKISSPIAMRRSDVAGVTLQMKWISDNFEKHMVIMKRIAAAYCDLKI